MAMAEKTGIAGVFERGANHFGPIAPYAYLAAQRGGASFICSNAATTIAPRAASKRVWGITHSGSAFPRRVEIP